MGVSAGVFGIARSELMARPVRISAVMDIECQCKIVFANLRHRLAKVIDRGSFYLGFLSLKKSFFS